MFNDLNDIETRPYPSEHSCRLEDPGKYKKFRRQNCAQKHDGKCIDVIYGIIKPGQSEIQALRYKIDTWNAVAARKHCKSRKGTFEPATQKSDDTDIEHRHFPIESLAVELRDDDIKKIVGHAAVFDEIGDGGWFKEKVAVGAFKQSIKKDDIRALFNHNSNLILGRNKAGTLKLKEDEKGLAIEINPPDIQYAKDLIVSIERGDISQMSFGFITLEDTWEHKKGEPSMRTLNKVKLFDISPVTFPFYTGTDVALRSFEQSLEGKDKHKPKARLRNLILVNKLGGQHD